MENGHSWVNCSIAVVYWSFLGLLLGKSAILGETQDKLAEIPRVDIDTDKNVVV